MRYTLLFSTKCGAKSVNPANARLGSHARKPTPRRLRVFCSNSGIALAAANGGARAEGAGAHEQHASLHGPICVAGHRTSPLLLLQSTDCEVRFAVVEQVGFASFSLCGWCDSKRVSPVAAYWDRRRNRDKAHRKDAARGELFRDRRSRVRRQAA